MSFPWVVAISELSIGKGLNDFTAATTAEAVTPAAIVGNGEEYVSFTEEMVEVVVDGDVLHVKADVRKIEKSGLPVPDEKVKDEGVVQVVLATV